MDGRAARTGRRRSAGHGGRVAVRRHGRHAAGRARDVGERQALRSPVPRRVVSHEVARDAARHRALPRLRHGPRDRAGAGQAAGRALRGRDARDRRALAAASARGRGHRAGPREEHRRGVDGAARHPGRHGVPARARRVDRLRGAHLPPLRARRDGGRAPQPVSPGHRHLGHRLQDRGRHRAQPGHGGDGAGAARGRRAARDGRAGRGRPRARATGRRAGPRHGAAGGPVGAARRGGRAAGGRRPGGARGPDRGQDLSLAPGHVAQRERGGPGAGAAARHTGRGMDRRRGRGADLVRAEDRHRAGPAAAPGRRGDRARQGRGHHRRSGRRQDDDRARGGGADGRQDAARRAGGADRPRGQAPGREHRLDRDDPAPAARVPAADAELRPQRGRSAARRCGRGGRDVDGRHRAVPRA